MKICFLGCGSIGRRHIKLLQKMGYSDLYALRTHKGQQEIDFQINELSSWGEVESLKPEVAFITNPTFLHIETSQRCAEMGSHLFLSAGTGFYLCLLCILQVTAIMA